MVKFENIWREQCDAALNIKSRFGEREALEYLVGEKLLRFVSAARSQPAFAAELPSFVAQIRQTFPREVLLAYLDELEVRLTEKSHDVDMDDTLLWTPEISDLTSLNQIMDLLRAEHLGRA